MASLTPPIPPCGAGTSTEPIKSQPSQTNPTGSTAHQAHHHPHGSRFTRFFSKFTTATIHSKRKSSLPNLHHHQNSHPSPTLPLSKQPSVDLQATIKAHNPSRPPNHILPSIPTLQPIHSTLSHPSLSLHSSATVSDDHNGTDEIDGADPNASIRPRSS